MNLLQAPKNKKLVITKIECSDIVKQRLNNLDIYDGVHIVIVRSAPLGDPLIVEINDNLVAVRKSDAQNISVEAL